MVRRLREGPDTGLHRAIGAPICSTALHSPVCPDRCNDQGSRWILRPLSLPDESSMMSSNSRSLALCDDLFASRYVEHAIAPFGTEEPGVVDGPSHIRGVVTWLVDQFPDIHMEVQSVVGDDSTATVLVRSTGTNLGRLNGFMPPPARHSTPDRTTGIAPSMGDWWSTGP